MTGAARATFARIMPPQLWLDESIMLSVAPFILALVGLSLGAGPCICGVDSLLSREGRVRNPEKPDGHSHSSQEHGHSGDPAERRGSDPCCECPEAEQDLALQCSPRIGTYLKAVLPECVPDSPQPLRFLRLSQTSARLASGLLGVLLFLRLCRLIR